VRGAENEKENERHSQGHERGAGGDDVSEKDEKQSAKRSECGWAGCPSNGEVGLDERQWCRGHFFRVASKRLEGCRAIVGDLAENRQQELGAAAKFLTELIGQSTSLAASAQFLAPAEREQLLEISLAAADCWKKLQDRGRSQRGKTAQIAQ